MPQPIRIGLLGLGNIGAGVLRALDANRDTLAKRTTRPLSVVAIADQDTTTRRDTGSFDYAPLLTDDAASMLDRPDVDVVIELIGGREPARSFVERALESGKHVVTANKALLAAHGPELAATARKHGAQLLFEASVGGGIPIVRTLQQGLAANRFRGVYGIFNGTTNYILTRMADHGGTFEEALADAQAKGYAEPDPTFDIEGLDTAHKTAILAWLAFGRPTRGDEVHVEGLTQVAPEDLRFAADHGYCMKFLGIARLADEGRLDLRAHPALVPDSSLLASVDDVYNAVMVEGDPIGQTLLYGRGAGPEATASAVLSDVVALADAIATGGLERESRLLNGSASLPLLPMTDLRAAYYLRIESDGAADAVLASLDGLGVGLAAQERREAGGIRLLTERAAEEGIAASLGAAGASRRFSARVADV